jgi:hypothetical protein
MTAVLQCLEARLENWLCEDPMSRSVIGLDPA